MLQFLNKTLQLSHQGENSTVKPIIFRNNTKPWYLIVPAVIRRQGAFGPAGLQGRRQGLLGSAGLQDGFWSLVKLVICATLQSINQN